MKKRLMVISLVLSFLSSVNASEFDTKVSVGASSAKLKSTTYTQYSIGYTSNTRLDNGIILGFGNSLSYGNVKSGIEAISVDLDLRAGYEIIDNLTGFILGTGVAQTIDNNSATGLGYGGSLEYRLNSNVSIAGTYKTVTMNDSPRDYDYDTSNLAVKFNF
jgi:opacity protein-like surface antigen